jgi:sterol desaturase/sphingolipid hydroxylase (fatty acid hydroxylase superfamily)
VKVSVRTTAVLVGYLLVSVSVITSGFASGARTTIVVSRISRRRAFLSRTNLALSSSSSRLNRRNLALSLFAAAVLLVLVVVALLIALTAIEARPLTVGLILQGGSCVGALFGVLQLAVTVEVFLMIVRVGLVTVRVFVVE